MVKQRNKHIAQQPPYPDKAEAGNDTAFLLLILETVRHDLNYLHFSENDTKKKIAGSELNRTNWFEKSFSFNRFFYKNNSGPIMYCKSIYLGHVALFFHLLYEAGLIHPHVGKCYMKEAAKHILSNGNKVSERYMSKLCCEILADPVKNNHIIAQVEAMIAKIVIEDKTAI